MAKFDLIKIKEDFPILKRQINGKRLVYLDNAATSQKPTQVIQAMKDYYELHNSNVHRGAHTLGEEATELLEQARSKVRKFINAKKDEEIIFTRGTTEAINLVSHTYGQDKVGVRGGVLLTEMEHHSNLVPWQQVALKNKSSLDYIGITDDGQLNEMDLGKLDKGNSVFSFVHASNVLGTINPAKNLIKRAHKSGTTVMLDAAQSVPHMPVDVRDLDCDFMAFSGHKMLGPTGIGVLYAKKEFLEEMNPFNYGGSMIKEVHLRNTSWADIPAKFEAGTPNIAGSVGLGAAVDYLSRVGMENIRNHEKKLTKYALEKLEGVKDMRIFGPEDFKIRGGVISMVLGDVHAHDVAAVLDKEGVEIRSGHHCTMPLHTRLGVPATARASFYLYNTEEDVDALVSALNKASKILG
jgi:cysteine desulfurase/selenocysteine lyase